MLKATDLSEVALTGGKDLWYEGKQSAFLSVNINSRKDSTILTHIKLLGY